MRDFLYQQLKLFPLCRASSQLCYFGGVRRNSFGHAWCDRGETYVVSRCLACARLQHFFCSVDCSCRDACFSGPLRSVAIQRDTNSAHPRLRATSQPHETSRQFATPTRRTRNPISNGDDISRSRVAIPTVLISGPGHARNIFMAKFIVDIVFRP
jgi:hypothetical protein